jgi:hypothetical protein
MSYHMVHSRDRIVNYDQKRVVATCGMRVLVNRTMYAPLVPHPLNSDITCPGCIAILREREKEARRAATPGRHKTDQPEGEVR